MKYIIISAILIIGIVFSNSELNSNNKFQINVDKSRIAILKIDKLNDINKSNYKNAELSNDELEQIELLFTMCLQEYNSKKKKEYIKDNKSNPKLKLKKSFYLIDYVKYYRQYIPYVNKNGEKEVYINCLCDVDGYDWKTNLISVMDGGKCFFQLKINLKQNKYYSFNVNGYA